MNKVLFLNHPIVGHLNVLLSIAMQIRDDGHDPGFLLPGVKGKKTGIQVLDAGLVVQGLVQKSGIRLDLIRPSLFVGLGAIFLPFRSGHDETVHAMNLLTRSLKSATKNILKFIKASTPDVIVAEFTFLPGILASEVAGIPYVIVYHTGLPFRGNMIPPFGSGLAIGVDDARAAAPYIRRENVLLQKIDRRFNSARHAFGLPPYAPDIMRRPVSPWLNLVTSVEAAEAPRTNLTANTIFIGPCFSKRKGQATGFPFDRLQADKYKIYASLGTIFNNRPNVFRKIMRALSAPEYQVIISAGGAYKTLSQGKIPKNVMLFPSVPQVDVLPAMDLVIGHGGNNSTNETLAAGKPLIVMPVGGEQCDNARRVEYLGVGRYIDIKHFEDHDIRRAVEEIRNNSTFQERSQAVMLAIGSTEGSSTASRCVDWVVRNKTPLNRPQGFPLTVTPENLPQLLNKAR